jgi:hypothetical protein
MHVEIHDTVCAKLAAKGRRSLVVHRRLGPVEPGGLEFHDDENCSKRQSDRVNDLSCRRAETSHPPARFSPPARALSRAARARA